MEIGKGYFANALRWLMDLRGRVPLEADEHVYPMVQVGTTDVPGVQADREGELVSGWGSMTATGVNTPKVAWALPTDYAKYFVLRQLFVYHTPADTTIYLWKSTPTALGGIGVYTVTDQARYLERNVNQQVGPFLIAQQDSAALAGTPSHQCAVGLDKIIDLLVPPFCIRPGETLIVEGRGSLGSLRIGWWGQLFSRRGSGLE